MFRLEKLRNDDMTETESDENHENVVYFENNRHNFKNEEITQIMMLEVTRIRSDSDNDIGGESDNDIRSDSDNDIGGDADNDFESDLDANSYLTDDNDACGVNSDIEEPLYSGADISVCGAYCAIMHLKSKCHLSFSTIDELLKLLKMICPQNNKLPSSVYILRKFFSQFESLKKKTIFCSNCHEIIDGKCCNTDCVKRNGEPDVLIHLNLPKQFRTILSRKSTKTVLVIYMFFYCNYTSCGDITFFA